MYLYMCLGDFPRFGFVRLFLPLHTRKKSKVCQKDHKHKKRLATVMWPEITNIDINRQSSDLFLSEQGTPKNQRNAEISLIENMADRKSGHKLSKNHDFGHILSTWSWGHKTWKNRETHAQWVKFGRYAKVCIVFGSPEREVLKVSYCDHPVSVMHRHQFL